mgnify:CR=1 FL=1
MRRIMYLCSILGLLLSACANEYPPSTPTKNPTPVRTKTPTATDTLYFDDFSDPQSGWKIDDNESFLLSYTSGSYYIYGYKSDYLSMSINKSEKFNDGVINVKYQHLFGERDDTGAVIFWRFIDIDNFYFMQIYGNGFFTISKYYQGNLIDLCDLTDSHLINSGTDPNRITIALRGNNADFYVNGNYVTSILDNSFDEGYIGLGGFQSLSSDVQIAYNEIAIYRYDLTNSHIPKKPNATSTPIYHSITWKELADFIARDHTNWNQYDFNNYVCLDFAIDLVENARKEKINAWIVGVDFANGETGHAFVAFKTSDKGTIYVEPQADYTYSNVSVGNYLCDDWEKAACMGKITSITNFSECDHDHYCMEMNP